MPFKLGPWEIGLILIIVLIIFGAGKLPQIGGAIGKGIRSFKQGQRGEDEDEAEEAKEQPKTAKRVRKTTAKS